MKVSYIELAGEKHPMCFSLSATEDIIDTFGGVDEMSAAIVNDNDLGKKLRAISKTLEILIKAGRIYCEAIGEPVPAPLKCRAADLIDITSPEAVKAIFSTIQNDTARTVEAEPSKNGAPAQE